MAREVRGRISDMAKSPKPIPNFIVGSPQFKWGGLNTSVKDNRYLDRGESYEQNNWITGRDQDHIELRRGSFILGNTTRNVAGAFITGLGIGIKNDGTQIPFFSYLQKILYYDPIADNTFEIGTNILPILASGDNTNFMPYQNLAGSYVYLTSLNSSLYKISLANLGSYINLSSSVVIGNPTISLATPAVITLSNTFVAGQTIIFTTTGVLPTGISPNVVYYVLATGLSTSSFEISATNGGTAVNTSGSQSGTHTITQVNSAVDYHFNFAKINRGRMFGVNRKGNNPNSLDPTSLYVSAPDSNTVGNSAQSFSVGTGDGTTKTFTGTISLTAPNTAYAISITDNNEVFKDDNNGNLVGTLGGIGTINYITGVYSVTFNTAPLNAQIINGSNYQENSTTLGVADFSNISASAAQVIPQADGGGLAKAVWPFNGVEYCFHQLRSWQLTITEGNPATFDNEPYFEQIGIPSIRGSFPTGDGILFLNNALPSEPKVSLLEIPEGSTNLTVVPQSISDALDLSSYGIENVVVLRWGDYDIVSLQNQVNGMTSTYNGVTFIRNIVSGLWNQLDFFINCAADLNGTLIAGSSISANVQQLFYGFNDNGTTIPNIHKQALTNLEIEGLKKVGYINFSGLIQAGQNLDIFITLDNGAYTKVFTISGTGPYVNSSIVTVGSQGIGVGTVGGGFDNEPVYASRYEVDIPIHTGLFEYIGWAVQATSFGFVSVERQEWKDIRFKRARLLSFEDSEIDN